MIFGEVWSFSTVATHEPQVELCQALMNEWLDRVEESARG
jgi:hypothetical protein